MPLKWSNLGGGNMMSICVFSVDERFVYKRGLGVIYIWYDTKVWKEGSTKRCV